MIAPLTELLRSDEPSQRNPLQHSIPKHFIQLQLIHMDIPDMTAACCICAYARVQCCFKARFVDVAEWCLDKVTALHRAISIDRDHAFTSSARTALAGMVLVVDGKEWIDAGEGTALLLAVIIWSAFVGVDPQVDR